MASVFKKARDRKRSGSSWYIAYSDERGVRRSVKGCPDRAATEAMARKLESETELRRRGVIDPRSDAFAAHEARPLTEHLADYHAYLIAKGATVDHAELVRARCRRIIDSACLKHLSDVTTSRFHSALKAVRDSGAALRTVHHYVRQFKAFSHWLCRDGRIREDSLAHVSPPNTEPDRRHDRRALTPEELSRLIQSAESGPVLWKLSGADRAVLYLVAIGTGFRRNELRSLKPEAFALDTEPPTITVAAAYSKRRRDDVQPIRTDLAEALRPWLASRALGLPVFGKLTKHTAAMIRADLERAGISYRDSMGRVADFHALRHSYISALAKSNTPVKIVQSLARHSTPTLTLGVYAHVGLFDQTGALEALPDLTPAAPRSEWGALPATGTDGCASEPKWVAPGQRAGDGTGRGLSVRFGNEDLNDHSQAGMSMVCNSLSETDLDGSCREETDSDSGGGGIRTHGTAMRYTGFRDRPFQPLRHPSVGVKSDEKGDDATGRNRSGSYHIRPRGARNSLRRDDSNAGRTRSGRASRKHPLSGLYIHTPGVSLAPGRSRRRTWDRARASRRAYTHRVATSPRPSPPTRGRGVPRGPSGRRGSP